MEGPGKSTSFRREFPAFKIQQQRRQHDLLQVCSRLWAIFIFLLKYLCSRILSPCQWKLNELKAYNSQQTYQRSSLLTLLAAQCDVRKLQHLTPAVLPVGVAVAVSRDLKVPNA